MRGSIHSSRRSLAAFGSKLALFVALAGCLSFALVLPAGAGASFGIEAFGGSFTNRDGSPDLQAGSHPYAFTTSITLNSMINAAGEHIVGSDGNVKDIAVETPPGLVGDPTAIPACTDAQLLQYGQGWGSCPPGSQVGQLTVHTTIIGELTVPLSNLVPSPGEPARLGAFILAAPVFIDTHVRSGGDYGLTASLSNITTLAPFFSSMVTLWGVPGDASHDVVRGGVCIGDPSKLEDCFAGGFSTNASPRPFLTLPTSCVGPQETRSSVDSWQAHGEFFTANFLTRDALSNPAGFEGCNRLDFTPAIGVVPSTSVVDSPTGLHVDLHIPPAGLQDTEGLAAANLKNAVVTLPAGMTVNPSVANGLAACSPAQIALSSAAPAARPDAAKVGSVEVDTPILAHPLEGSVYVAEQGNNPFGSLLAIYIAVADPETGVVVKVAGHVMPDPVTGQLTATFDNNPQLPFSDLKLDFYGGPRASLVNPDVCGSYTVNTQLTPWSTETPAAPSSVFVVNQGSHGAQFAPSFTAGTA